MFHHRCFKSASELCHFVEKSCITLQKHVVPFYFKLAIVGNEIFSNDDIISVALVIIFAVFTATKILN